MGHRLVAIGVITGASIIGLLNKRHIGDTIGTPSSDFREEIRRIPVHEVKKYRASHPGISIMEAYSRLNTSRKYRKQETHDA